MNADTDGEEDDMQSPNVDPAISQTKIDSIQSDGDCSAYQVDVLKDYDQAIEHEKILNSHKKKRLFSEDLESAPGDATNAPFDISNNLNSNNSFIDTKLGHQVRNSNVK